MPQSTRITFDVTAGSSVTAYWIAVGNDDVPLTNGKGSISLPAGKHFLTWWFMGDSGGKLSITGKNHGRQVVTVKNSRIPSGETEGAGTKRFTV